MHIFELLAEPIRRRIVEVLASGEANAGDIESLIMQEFGVGRSAVYRHLKLLRDHEFVHVHEDDWPHHSYRLDDGVIGTLEDEAARLRGLWEQRIGRRVRADPLRGFSGASLRGRRGRGIDPDDPWLHRGNPI
ncbi:ArsR/SmtB family transcription factor [Lacisediminihabitans sp.]|uniref:ArsR/SmtB family transcription factor n=1 Tax=Lacisediminihabitans sp. TaxID=2787631 RepID=UPI0039C8CEF4